MIRLNHRLLKLENRLKASQVKTAYEIVMNMSEEELDALLQYGHMLDSDDDADLPPEIAAMTLDELERNYFELLRKHI